MTFADFGFEERIQRGIDEAGFETPMPVQSECFELLVRNHRDIYAQSQTGTGKTAAFLLGIFQLLLTEEEYRGEKALIIVPTRELAVQIEREGKMLGKYLDFTIGSVYGGVGYRGQETMLEEGVDVLIGTPGRLIDFSRQAKVQLKDFRFLVIDEADRLFDMGFLPDLRRILKGMRHQSERHTLLFSATLNARVGNLAWEYMNDPGEVIIEPEKVTVDTVTQELYHVGKDEKLQLLLGLLKRDDPENAVIFTNTRHSTWEVAKRMEVNGYAVRFLMGDLPQSKRTRIVDEVKKGHHKFLVATDVAARGLHIDDLEMVINYDVPLEAESYVHRIGRTARAGREGKTITMACEEYVYGLGPIERLLGRKIPVSWADESLIIEDKSAGMRFPPSERYRELGEPGERRGEAPRRGRGGRDQERRPGRGPGGGRRSLDPRAARIQSAVSSVAGGGEAQGAGGRRVEGRGLRGGRGDGPGAGGRRGEERGGERRDRPGRGERPDRRGENRGRRPGSGASGEGASRGPRGGGDYGGSEWEGRERGGAKFDQPRIKSGSSMDDRLEYYRRKYGEDFTFAGGASPGVSAGSQGGASPAGAGDGSSSPRSSGFSRLKRRRRRPEGRAGSQGRSGPEVSGNRRPGDEVSRDEGPRKPGRRDGIAPEGARASGRGAGSGGARNQGAGKAGRAKGGSSSAGETGKTGWLARLLGGKRRRGN